MTMDMSRYSETSYVGSGGMASVYKAFDQKLRRHVAIKELNEQFRENGEVRNLFLNEVAGYFQVGRVLLAIILMDL